MAVVGTVYASSKFQKALQDNWDNVFKEKYMATAFTASKDPREDLQVSFHNDVTCDALLIFIWRRSPKGQVTCLCLNGEWKMIGEGSQMEPAIELTQVIKDDFLAKMKIAIATVLLDKDELVKDERLEHLTNMNTNLQRTLLRSEGLNRRLLSVVEKQAGLEAYRPQEEHDDSPTRADSPDTGGPARSFGELMKMGKQDV